MIVSSRGSKTAVHIRPDLRQTSTGCKRILHGHGTTENPNVYIVPSLIFIRVDHATPTRPKICTYAGGSAKRLREKTALTPPKNITRTGRLNHEAKNRRVLGGGLVVDAKLLPSLTTKKI
ncbi:unnamed protein product [Ectocarpus sp. 12 AP-2014]